METQTLIAVLIGSLLLTAATAAMPLAGIAVAVTANGVIALLEKDAQERMAFAGVTLPPVLAGLLWWLAPGIGG